MNQHLLRNHLSKHDQKVLETLFACVQLPDGDLLLSDFDVQTDLEDPPELQTAEVRVSKKYEVEAIQLAEAKNFPEAIKLFDKAIEICPDRASVYNNRAQAQRLSGNDEEALKDLARAVELSANNDRTRCQALCQRGLIYRKLEQDEAARSDFGQAAKLGSKFAKNQLVELNPYAALCNQMLQKAFADLQ